jgi:hypothetical protein
MIEAVQVWSHRQAEAREKWLRARTEAEGKASLPSSVNRPAGSFSEGSGQRFEQLAYQEASQVAGDQIPRKSGGISELYRGMFRRKAISSRD